MEREGECLPALWAYVTNDYRIAVFDLESKRNGEVTGGRVGRSSLWNLDVTFPFMMALNASFSSSKTTA